MDAQGEAFTPLPDHLIQTAKGKEEKLRNMDPTNIFSSNALERTETNMCINCEEKEMCGVYATTRAMTKKDEAEKNADAAKRKLETKSLEDSRPATSCRGESRSEGRR